MYDVTMISIQTFHIVIFAAGILCHTVNGLKCYQCASHIHGRERCGELSNLTTSDLEFIVECQSSCKLTYIENINGGENLFARMCGDNMEEKCIEQALKRNYTGKNCQCRTDFCNLNWQTQDNVEYDELAAYEVRNNAENVRTSLSLWIVTWIGIFVRS